MTSAESHLVGVCELFEEKWDTVSWPTTKPSLRNENTLIMPSLPPHQRDLKGILLMYNLYKYIILYKRN